MAHDYCPMAPPEHKEPLFFPTKNLQASLNIWSPLERRKKLRCSTLLAETFCKYRSICFCAAALEGLCESQQSRNPRRLMRNDRSWAAGNEFSAGLSCWDSTSVQKANRGLILSLNLLLWLLEMLTLAPFLSTGLRIWHRETGCQQSQWIIIINACMII